MVNVSISEVELRALLWALRNSGNAGSDEMVYAKESVYRKLAKKLSRM